MRCLIVSARHHPGQGGVGACVGAFASGAVEAGWHIELLTKPSDHLPRVPRLHLVTTPDDEPGFTSRITTLRGIERIRPYRYGLWSLAVAEYLLENEFDVEVVQFVDVQAEGCVSIMSRAVRSRFRGVPFVVSAHGPMGLVETLAGKDPERFGRSIYHGWEREALLGADGVLGLSSLLLDSIGPLNNVQALPPIAPAICDENEFRDDPIITLIGDVEVHKGVEDWANSLNDVFQSIEDVRAILIGPDTPSGPAGKSMAVHVSSLIEPAHRHRFLYLGGLDHDQVMDVIESDAVAAMG